MNKKMTVLGYSIDAVLEAIHRATAPDTEVTLLATAPLGSPLDLYGDMVSNRYAEMISELLGGTLSFEEYVNPRFIYLPFAGVKIANRHNGVIQFPLTKKSFDDESEWKECADAIGSEEVKAIMGDLSLAPTKLISVLKSKMPAKFIDTFIKSMANTRWRGVQIARMSMQGYRYEYPLDFIGREDYMEYYAKPNMSFREICNRLLKKFHVATKQIDLVEAKRIVMDNKYPGDTIIMDNRVDQLVDYIGGRFERQKIRPVKMKVPPELEFAGNGLFYTPLSTCWAVTVFDGKAKRFMSNVVETLYDGELTEIPSTKANIKLYDTYVNLVRQFGRKELMLGQRVETMIK